MVTPADHTMCLKIAPSGIRTTEAYSSRTVPPTHCSALVQVDCNAQRPNASQLHWEIKWEMTSALALTTNITDVHAPLPSHPCFVTFKFYSSSSFFPISFQYTAQVAVLRMNRTTPILSCLATPHTCARVCYHQRRYTHSCTHKQKHICTSSTAMRLHFD